MGLNFLSKHFPPEEYLKPNHVGLSFSDTSVKAICFEKKSGKPHFHSMIVPLEKKTIVDGAIVNMEGLVKKLSLVRKNFDTRFVFFAVPDELTFVFTASVPISGDDATEAVAFVIEENVPLTLAETLFDFEPIQVSKTENEGQTASVVVTAGIKKEIEKFTQAIYESGFEPVGCAHESQAIVGAVVPKNFLGTYAIVHARENRIGIHLVKNRLVYFSTIRNFAEGNYKTEFLDEYGKFLEYCDRYGAGSTEQLKAVFVCGEFPNAQKVIEAVNDSNNLSQNIKLSNVWVNAFEVDKYPPDIPFEKSLSFAGSIGAALS